MPSPQQYNNNYYDLATKIRNGAKFTKDKRVNRDKSLNSSRSVPGPGSYEHTPSMNQSSFNKKEILVKGQKRFRNPSDLTPGPNQYNNSNKNPQFVPNFSIGRMKRSLKEMIAANNHPAAANYNPIMNKSRSVSVYFSSYSD